MGVGTVTSAYSGTAVQAGWTFRHNGVNAATWPDNTGVCGDFIDATIVAGATDGDRYLVRQAANGLTIGTNLRDRVTDARDDVDALALGEPDLIIVWIGANDAQDDAEATTFAAYHGLRREIEVLRGEFPLSPVLLLHERTTDSGQYPAVADGRIDAARVAVAAAMTSVRVVSAASIDLADAIHPSAAGYTTMAARALTASAP